MLITNDELKALVLKNHLINEAGLAEIFEYITNTEATLYDSLIEKNIITDENLGILVADQLKIPFVVLSKISIPVEGFRIIPERIARKYRLISFGKDEKGIKVATADPKNKKQIEMITKKTGEKVVVYLATERDIDNAFHIYRKDIQKKFDSILNNDIYAKTSRTILDEAPIAKIVDMVIEYAYQDRASDVHIEPQEEDTLIRFRIDGMLHDTLKFPKDLHDRVISRIKVLSRLRTDEHMAAQDGKMRLDMAEEKLDIRVSILPIADGEKVVMRLLSTHTRQFSLIDLGMSEIDLKKLTTAINKSFGMILSTGPTGSGKSTSIYAILKIINRREKNITTIEDPVEYRIKGVNQINVNPKTGLTFASGLRSILRQDPNVIFVGEIRDIETAGIAVNAALTGHLVLSTLHTNDASTTLPRLTDMKIEPFLVASTVNVIVAQRLIRKICDMCKASIDITKEELAKNMPIELLNKHFADANPIRIFHGQGCKICHNTGYVGRVGVFEVLEISKEIRKLIVSKADADIIAHQAISEGMTTILDDGMDKVKAGVTTLEEVLRVTKFDTL